MKRSMMKYTLIAALLLSLPHVVSAQRDSTKLNQSVDVMKAYQPSMTGANKISTQPVISDTTRFVPGFNYSITSHPIGSGFSASPITAATINSRSQSNLTPGYLKLGLGGYNTPYGDLFLSVPKSPVATFGIHLRHISSTGQVRLKSGDKVDAPFSQNNAELLSSVNIGNAILSANLDYRRDAVTYYGYPDTIPTVNTSYFVPLNGTKQIYQKIGFEARVRDNGHAQSLLTYNTGIRLGYFDAKSGQVETNGSFFGKFGYTFGQVKGVLDFQYDHFSTDSVSSGTATTITNKKEDWISASPSLLLEGDNWTARGGVRFISVIDVTNGSETRLYPDFEATFRPVNGLTLFGSFSGDFKRNGYATIAYENPWVDPFHNVRTTDYVYSFQGGVKGKILPGLTYLMGFNYSRIKDLYFYITEYVQRYYIMSGPPSFEYSQTFTPVYDNGKLLNWKWELNYASGADYAFHLKANVYNYNLEHLKEAYNKPKFDLAANASFVVIPRVKGLIEVEAVGSRKALIAPPMYINTMGTVRELDPMILVNIGATYDLGTKLQIFGRVDNLLNRNDEPWLGYTNQRMRLMGGIIVNF